MGLRTYGAILGFLIGLAFVLAWEMSGGSVPNSLNAGSNHPSVISLYPGQSPASPSTSVGLLLPKDSAFYRIARECMQEGDIESAIEVAASMPAGEGRDKLLIMVADMFTSSSFKNMPSNSDGNMQDSLKSAEATVSKINEMAQMCDSRYSAIIMKTMIAKTKKELELNGSISKPSSKDILKSALRDVLTVQDNLPPDGVLASWRKTLAIPFMALLSAAGYLSVKFLESLCESFTKYIGDKFFNPLLQLTMDRFSPQPDEGRQNQNEVTAKSAPNQVV